MTREEANTDPINIFDGKTMTPRGKLVGIGEDDYKALLRLLSAARAWKTVTGMTNQIRANGALDRAVDALSHLEVEE